MSSKGYLTCAICNSGICMDMYISGKADIICPKCLKELICEYGKFIVSGDELIHYMLSNPREAYYVLNKIGFVIGEDGNSIDELYKELEKDYGDDSSDL